MFNIILLFLFLIAMEKYNLIQTSLILYFFWNEDIGKWPFPKTSAAKRIKKNKNKKNKPPAGTWTIQAHVPSSGQLLDHW